MLVFDSELKGLGVVHGMNYGLVFQAMGGVVESGGFTQRVSSRLLRKQFGDFHPWLKRRGVLWSPSYLASSCGSAPIEILRQYIEEQQTPNQDACGVRALDLGLNPEASRAYGEFATDCLCRYGVDFLQ
ncbi:transposase IS200 like family protein [Pseudomonas sp. StFLB209]|nr:transposase IS200 like family protein [Pseudomonas sp. StFLB209]